MTYSREAASAASHFLRNPERPQTGHFGTIQFLGNSHTNADTILTQTVVHTYNTTKDMWSQNMTIFPLLFLFAFTTACTTVQAVILLNKSPHISLLCANLVVRKFIADNNFQRCVA